jgi:hypothetical protein
MPIFVLFALFILAIVLGTFWGLVVLATSRFKEDTRRVVRMVALGLAVLGAAIYGYLVLLLLDAHFDTEDFWSPSEQTQLEKYTEACEGPLAPGTSLEEVHEWLADAGILALSDPNRDPEMRVAYREGKNEDTNYHAIQIRDMNVRNWNVAGEIDVDTHITFEADRVTRCSATLFRHGR